jgi:hypothetical protein
MHSSAYVPRTIQIVSFNFAFAKLVDAIQTSRKFAWFTNKFTWLVFDVMELSIGLVQHMLIVFNTAVENA